MLGMAVSLLPHVLGKRALPHLQFLAMDAWNLVPGEDDVIVA